MVLPSEAPRSKLANISKPAGVRYLASIHVPRMTACGWAATDAIRRSVNWLRLDRRWRTAGHGATTVLVRKYMLRE
jgi:hypothetical protein